MIPAVRQQRIVARLRQRGGQTVGDLAASLDVSPSTIRRDLSLMELEGVLRRSFGGAVLAPERDEPIGDAALTNREEKLAIATAAGRFVEDGMAVIIDVGSTALALATSLRGRELTIITASLPVFAVFAHEPSVRILLLGGGYSADYQCTTGHMTVNALKDVRADVAFLGCSGVSPGGDIRDNTADQVPVKRAIIAAAAASVLLSDATKYPGQGTYTVGAISDMAAVVTTAPLPVAVRKKLDISGTEVVYA